MDRESAIADDLIRGAAAIAEELFGNDPRGRRRVYHLSSDTKGGDKLPVFRMGATICARRSTLRRWIAEREAVQPSR
jgi:hypothetical protein